MEIQFGKTQQLFNSKQYYLNKSDPIESDFNKNKTEIEVFIFNNHTIIYRENLI